MSSPLALCAALFHCLWQPLHQKHLVQEGNRTAFAQRILKCVYIFRFSMLWWHVISNKSDTANPEGVLTLLSQHSAYKRFVKLFVFSPIISNTTELPQKFTQ